MSSRDPAEIVVVGAGGVVGRRVVAELIGAGASVGTATRHPLALEGIPAHRRHVADVFDAAALARAFAGARVVIHAAGPLRESASPVLIAALASGAHYVDVGGEQGVLHALYERHESTVRRSGLVAMPGAGLDCVIGDLAAAWAARHLVGEPEPPGPVVRDEPIARLAEDRPLDEVAVSYVFDDLVLSAGAQRALFGAVGTRALVWYRDRWEAGRAGDHRRINAGPALGGERDAMAHVGGDAIAIPRHIATRFSGSYVSTTRRPGAAGAMRWLARALPLVPRAAAELLAPYAPPDADYGRTRFAVVAQVRRGFSAAQIVVRGVDPYRTTAVVCAWVARALASRGAGPIGMRAPAELFRAEPALTQIATSAGLEIEASFGPGADPHRAGLSE
ncbi:MAG: saccharopine dehydrogenase NADP-binding domain-containing protein [Kofleriaceae bacterium]